MLLIIRAHIYTETKSNTQKDLRRVFEKMSDKFTVDLMPSGQVIVSIIELWDNKVELD